MTLTSILVLLAIGLLAGWLAGLIMKGRGMGLLWNLIIGVAGSFLGGFLFGLFNISIISPLVTRIIAAVAGAIIILAIINLIKRR
ncbi:MAG TPA: GlsB/YeaQ/YmgE family stress response membrane protein [Spirochaetota bacterium]|nr:GlsB/YeaQ/YmgE family stress response membrane protein [Spirochaetota bacterium]HOD13310.1 GlsB/YeaQ/YmgE family stress response membrane protein [Spirochaetota bacterium]HPG49598.1 GlsB/YeaQ/YmgE family stress response membrane protein [Spirochaetota bacterium]HPN11649.1 GlsB/YeaQ/YmgE family stress response membrane protein [Spirochaetota bacterium]HQL83694.1 GlsB/YeaQ/YmgE family stress response membrane protein [Spirochaetota bacterium]